MKTHALPVAAVAVAALLGIAVALPQTTLVTAALATLLLAGVLSARAPYALILAYVATRPLVDAFVYYEIGGLTLGQVWSVGLLVMLVVMLLSPSDRLGIVRSRTDVIPACFVLAYALVMLVHGGAFAALAQTAKLASWLLLALVTRRIASTERGAEDVLTWGFVLGWVTVAVVAAMSVMGRFGFAYYFDRESFVGTLSAGPHGLAALAVLCLAFPVLNLVYGRRERLSRVLIVLLIASIGVSFVRSAWVSLVVAIAVFLVFSVGRKDRRALTRVGMAFLVTVAGVATVFSQKVTERLADIGLASGSGLQLTLESGSGRIALWLVAVAAASRNAETLLFGRGLTASFEVNRSALGLPLIAHNDFLEFLLSGGLLVASLYVALLAWMALGAWSTFRGSALPREIRTTGLVTVAMIAAYAVFSLANGIAFGQASLALALLLGLSRGLADSFDADLAAEDPPMAVAPGIPARETAL